MADERRVAAIRELDNGDVILMLVSAIGEG